MYQAYILEEKCMESGQYYNYQRYCYVKILPDTVHVWTYSEDPEKILSASISDVIFVSENDNDEHDDTFKRIMQRYGLDSLKFADLYDVVIAKSPKREFCINPNPQINIGYESLKNCTETFSKYLKETKQIFDYSHFKGYISHDYKERLNKFDIYVQPVKKLLSYNPVLARKQAEKRKAYKEKRKKSPKKNLPRYALQVLHYDLRSVFSGNLNLTITYKDQYGSYRRKDWYAEQIMVSIDFFNLMFKKKYYRNFDSFKNICKAWKHLPEHEKKQYPEDFQNWMNTESEINPRPKIKIETHNIEPVNLNMFKISKLKWRKNAYIRL